LRGVTVGHAVCLALVRSSWAVTKGAVEGTWPVLEQILDRPVYATDDIDVVGGRRPSVVALELSRSCWLR
jgi:hypothetical protein